MLALVKRLLDSVPFFYSTVASWGIPCVLPFHKLQLPRRLWWEHYAMPHW